MYVKGDECAYVFPNEFPNPEFVKGLTDVVTKTDQMFFVVHECDGQAHVVAYPKARVFQDVKDMLDEEETNKKEEEKGDENRVEEVGG